ncbi:MAG: CCA tRNA nucleotidyltransferase [Mesorhizobium sp.]
MTEKASIAHADWLKAPDLQRLLGALSGDGEAARVAGGAVRNALLGQAVSDVDIATTNLPEDTIRRAEAAGFRTVPTGAAHGTVTVISRGKPYEVTTLRADIETDGRHAKVVFGRDWTRDAERRDFTINALYAEADGRVIDLVGGLADIEGRVLRFIGDPETRIREDYLRILRFFRFFAWYGSGRPDAAGLKACARLKEGLDRLSAERVWSELKKLLSAPEPARSLLWMRQSGILSRVLPETDRWGIDLVHPLVETEAALGWRPDPLLRIEAMVPPDVERMGSLAERLRLSRAEAERLKRWAQAETPAADMDGTSLRAAIYRGNRQALVDRLRLALAAARGQAGSDAGVLADVARRTRQLDFLEKWTKPVFPIGGSDLSTLGVAAGPAVGRMLRALEKDWIASDFSLDRGALLERAAKLLPEGQGKG